MINIAIIPPRMNEGSKMVFGYAGKFLRVNLSTEKVTHQVFDETILRSHLGGTALGVKILYEEVDPNISWSDPSNRIILASGPLGGTIIPGTGTFSLVTKGALTNGCTSVQANGLFGAYLKFSGYDGIVIEGIAKRWLYLNILEDDAELRNASHLLRRDTYETDDMIKQDLKKTDREMSVVSIGPAGETKCLPAGVFERKGHSASHNGPGAVMGSKRLKAIAVSRGSHRVEVQHPERVKKVAAIIRENALNFRGTVGGVHDTYKRNNGVLPIKNYTTNLWDIDDTKLTRYSEPSIRERYQPRPNPCWACPATHSTMMTIPEGPYAGTVIEEPEYEQLAAMGPVIDVRDVDQAAMLGSVCDRLGFDTNEMGWILGWVIECYERELLSNEDLGGLEMTWGNAEAARQLMYMIAHRQGFGDILAEGIMRASQQFGGEAARAAIYTLKGNSPRGHDHRTGWGEMFDTAVSSTGTIETHTILSAQSPYNAAAGNPQGTLEGVALTKGISIFVDSLGNCRFPSGLNHALLTEAAAAITGWNLTLEETKQIGLRAVNLMKVFNLRAGIRKDVDAPSTRYGSTPVDGPTHGIGIAKHWDDMLRSYYTLMGWEVETGKPLPKTLGALGLNHIIRDIW
jgi:aldehyde:ferredoxin oxidoreductase